MNLVLGSASPRRAELLAHLGVSFRVISADIDETPLPHESPHDYVRRMAREKSEALARESTTDLDKDIVLTADTTVVMDGASLGKPRDETDARAMLGRLSGRRHEVSTAVRGQFRDQQADVLVTTEVEFVDLSPALLDAYLATDEPWDKAGAYAIQGMAGSFVRRVNGSVSNVIGLPLAETRELLAGLGLAVTVGGVAS